MGQSGKSSKVRRMLGGLRVARAPAKHFKSPRYELIVVSTAFHVTGWGKRVKGRL